MRRDALRLWPTALVGLATFSCIRHEVGPPAPVLVSEECVLAEPPAAEARRQTIAIVRDASLGSPAKIDPMETVAVLREGEPDAPSYTAVTVWQNRSVLAIYGDNLVVTPRRGDAYRTKAWDPGPRQFIRAIHADDELRRAIFVATDRDSGSEDSFMLWDLRNGVALLDSPQMPEYEVGRFAHVLDVHFLSDGRILGLMTGARLHVWGADGTQIARIDDVAGGLDVAEDESRVVLAGGQIMKWVTSGEGMEGMAYVPVADKQVDLRNYEVRPYRKKAWKAWSTVPGKPESVHELSGRRVVGVYPQNGPTRTTVFDVDSGSKLSEFESFLGGPLFFSQDDRIAFVAQVGRPEQDEITVAGHDLADGSRRFQWSYRSPLLRDCSNEYTPELTFHTEPAEVVLRFVDYDTGRRAKRDDCTSTLTWFQLDGGEVNRTIRLPRFTDPVRGLAFDDAGARLAVFSEKGLSVYELGSGKETKLEPPLRFGSKPRRASVDWLDAEHVRVAVDGYARSISLHGTEAVPVAPPMVVPDDAQVLASSKDGEYRLLAHNPQKKSPGDVPVTSKSPSTAIVAADDRTAVTWNHEMIEVIPMGNPASSRRIDMTSIDVTAVAVSADGTVAAVGLHNGRVLLLDLSAG